MSAYVPDPSYNPNTPVVATYPTNNSVITVDPTTGALVSLYRYSDCIR